MSTAPALRGGCKRSSRRASNACTRKSKSSRTIEAPALLATVGTGCRLACHHSREQLQPFDLQPGCEYSALVIRPCAARSNFFFFNDTPPPDISPLPPHDPFPI